MRAFGLVVLGAAALAACDDKEQKFQLNDDGGVLPAIDSGTPGGSDGGQMHGSNNSGPVVDLINIASSIDPLQGAVITGGSLEVVCEAKQRTRGTAVDVTSVKVQLMDANNKPLGEAPLAAQGVDTFKGSVSLSMVPTGLVRVRCTAKDTTMGTALSNYGEVSTYYDGGPTITFEGLDAMSIVPRGDDSVDLPEFTIKFKVAPAPLAAGDVGAEVNTVVFKLRDEVKEAVKTEDGWKYDVDFEKLVGTGNAIGELKVEVQATNKRVPTAATASKVLVVRVDSTPPVISVLSPNANTFVRGRVKVITKITDDLSGVSANKAKTFATLGDGAKTVVELERVPDMADTYAFDFDASKFASMSDMTINITASDNVDNKAYKDLTLRFDSVAPWVSLKSPYVRDCVAGSTPATCSGRFLALGASPQDGDIISDSTRFRAMVFERGNIVDQAQQVWIAGVQEGSVILYAQANPAYPLIVDNDGDGTCDALSIDLVHGAGQNTLAPVGAGGARPPSSDSEALVEPAIPEGFVPLTGVTAGPKCVNTEMTFAITQKVSGRPTAVYAKSPEGDNCTGVSFNLGSGTGWTCVVAAAMDNNGNLGISEPIQVCRLGGTEKCESTKPSIARCMKNCTMPSLSTRSELGTGVLIY